MTKQKICAGCLVFLLLLFFLIAPAAGIIIKIDTEAPTISEVFVDPTTLEGSTLYTSSSPTVFADVTDYVSGIDASTCEVCVSLNSPCNTWSAGTYTGGANTGQCSRAYSGYSNGAVLFMNVRINDTAGNQGVGTQTSRTVKSGSGTGPSYTSTIPRGVLNYTESITPTFYVLGITDPDEPGVTANYCKFYLYVNGQISFAKEVAVTNRECVWMVETPLNNGNEAYVKFNISNTNGIVSGFAQTGKYKIRLPYEYEMYVAPKTAMAALGEEVIYQVTFKNTGYKPNRFRLEKVEKQCTQEVWVRTPVTTTGTIAMDETATLNIYAGLTTITEPCEILIEGRMEKTDGADWDEAYKKEETVTITLAGFNLPEIDLSWILLLVLLATVYFFAKSPKKVKKIKGVAKRGTKRKKK